LFAPRAFPEADALTATEALTATGTLLAPIAREASRVCVNKPKLALVGWEC